MSRKASTAAAPRATSPNLLRCMVLVVKVEVDDDVANGRSDLASEAVDGPGPPELYIQLFFRRFVRTIYNHQALCASLIFLKPSSNFLPPWVLCLKSGRWPRKSRKSISTARPAKNGSLVFANESSSASRMRRMQPKRDTRRRRGRTARGCAMTLTLCSRHWLTGRF